MDELKQRTPDRPRALNALGANLDDALARGREPARFAPPSRHLRGRRTWRIAGIAAAGIAALAAVLIGISSRQDSPLGVNDAVASLAAVAAAVKLPPPDAYTFTDSQLQGMQRVLPGSSKAKQAQAGSLITTQVNMRSWISQTKPGRVISGIAPMSSGGGRIVYRSFTYPPDGPLAIGSRRYTPKQLAAAAKDPQAVIDRVNAEVRAAPAAQRPLLKWTTLSNPLQARAAPIPSSLRAALISELSGIPGVTSLGTTKDSYGRAVEGFQLDADGLRHRLEFDPKTSALLESSTVALRDGVAGYSKTRKGMIIYRYRLVRSAVVDSLPK